MIPRPRKLLEGYSGAMKAGYTFCNGWWKTPAEYKKVRKQLHSNPNRNFNLVCQKMNADFLCQVREIIELFMWDRHCVWDDNDCYEKDGNGNVKFEDLHTD